MSVFDVLSRWLGGKPSIEDPAPDIPNFVPGPVLDDSPDDYDEHDDDEVEEPIFIGIKYRATDGAFSSRRITFRRIVRSEGGSASLMAFCHERRAPRRFRCDRIEYFFDSHGEIIEPDDFWREIGVDLASLPISPKPAPRPRTAATEAIPGVRRPTVKTEINMLAGLSRCDGVMHPAEVEAILLYYVDRLEDGGEMLSPETIEALRARVSRMRPTREAIALATEKLFIGPTRLEPSARARLLRAAHAVANADGVLKTEEFEFLAAVEAER